MNKEQDFDIVKKDEEARALGFKNYEEQRRDMSRRYKEEVKKGQELNLKKQNFLMEQRAKEEGFSSIIEREKAKREQQQNQPTFSTEKIVVPPPMVKKIEALEFVDPNIPGEIKIDSAGKLMKRYISYEGKIGSLIAQYDNFITYALSEHITSKSLMLPEGPVTFENIMLNRPMIKNLEGRMVPLYPQKARNSGYSYTADIYIDMVLNKGSDSEERINKAFLGKVPVMIGSELDWMTKKTEEERVKEGETIGESGGYFIIKGTEKIVMIQEKLRANRIFVFNSSSKGDIVCKVTNNTLSGSTQISMVKGKKSGSLKVHLGFLGRLGSTSANKLGRTISIFQIFRLLGVNKPSDMLNFVYLFTKPEFKKKIYVALQPSIVKITKIGDDIEYISKKKGLGDIAYEIRKKDIMNDLMSQLFPQIPADNKTAKLYMLSMMIGRLVEYLVGARELDDRDNWGNKQLVTAGKSLELLFSSIWKEAIVLAQTEIEEKKLSGLKAAQRVINSSYITDNFIDSFTPNNWGLQSSYLTKENITDILKRDSILSVYSHLTKINTPGSNKVKSTKIRMVQMSQLGYVDAAETPEGALCILETTPVLMANGEWKQIRDIVVGDVVVSVNPTTMERTATPIQNPFTFHTSTTDKVMYRLKTADKTIDATGDHPFLTQYGWIPMDKLNPVLDTVCVFKNDKYYYQKIKSIVEIPHAQVCDFTTLSDNHSFIADGFIVHNCGLTKNTAMTAYISLDRPEDIIMELIGKYISPVPTESTINPFILNGIFRGWVNGRELKTFCIAMKRGLKLSKDTAIVLERDGYFNIYTDACRPTRPLMIVDSDGQLVIARKNLWDADFETLLREGCIEYVDAWEQENIMLAQSLDDVEFRKRDIEMALQSLNESKEKLNRTFMDPADKKNAELYVIQSEAALKELVDLPPYSHSEMDPTAILSIAVGVIPMPETNPGPRLTYQSGMGKQALGIYHSNHAVRFDTTSKVLAYPSRPMFETQLQNVIGLDELPAGETVIVAITTYTGFAQEDAIVMSQGAIDRGLFRSIIYKTYRSIRKKTKNSREEFGRPEMKKGEEQRYAAIDENGLPQVGSFVKEGDCLIGKIRKNILTGKVENASSFVEVKQEGVVDRVLVSTNSEGEQVVKVKIRQVRKPVIGDKYASRYAQKGTIGLILPEEDMPFTAAGVRPDILIDPHCFSKDTPVSCYSGYSKRISDFTPEGGEKVLTWDETEKSFTVSTSAGMESKGVKKLINVYLEDGRVIKCTPDHKFLTVYTENSNGEIGYFWTEAKDLAPRRKLSPPLNGTINGKKILCGLEMPLDKPELDIGSTWSLQSAGYTFDMTTPLNREKSLAFARILGYTLTDGCISEREDLYYGYASTLNMGHDIDAKALQEDIFLITGKSPKYSESKGTVNIRLPASLSGAMGHLPGVQSGKRVEKIITLPEFLDDPNCPLSVIREFLGGLFGGDGISPHVPTRKNRRDTPLLCECAFSQSTKEPFKAALMEKMQHLARLFERVGVKTTRIDGPHLKSFSENSFDSKDGEDRYVCTLHLINNSDFATKVGFRYCIQKACRLAAACAYWRYQEEVARQHDWVVERTNELYISGKIRQHTNKKSIPLSLEKAREELKEREPVINEFYSLSNVTDIHNRRKIGGGSAKTLSKFLYDDKSKMLSVKQFFKKIGCLHWFERVDPSKQDYIVKRGSMNIPGFSLEVIGIKDAGEEEVFDIGVNDHHNFLAHGTVVHNCMPSRMTIGKLIEIVTSKAAAFSGERVNATAFRKFDVTEFMRNLKQYGYSGSGKERLYSGYTGEPLEAMIFIGPCYYQALRHQVADKIQMRARGGVSQLTHQPVGGRKRGGGLRIGEMERDAIISHGASAFLRERLCLVSDAFETVYCSSCGTMAIANILEDKYVCRNCEEHAAFGKCVVPYAYKLLTQLLMGAGISTKFNMQEVKK